MYQERKSPYQCVEISLFPKRKDYKGQRIDYAIIHLSTEGVISGPALKRNLEILVNSNGLTKAEDKIKKKLRHVGITIPANLRGLIKYEQEPKGNGSDPHYTIG